MTGSKQVEMTPEDFVLAYIKANEVVSAKSDKRDKTTGKPYLGAHVVYSGLNEELRARFNIDPRELIDKMAEAKQIVTRGVRGGIIVYTADNVPPAAVSGQRASVLETMGIK